MFAAVGNHVVALHRDRIGALDLPDDLAPGDYRRLAADEQTAIFDPTGVSHQPGRDSKDGDRRGGRNPPHSPAAARPT
jgi:hypothetical protein